MNKIICLLLTAIITACGITRPNFPDEIPIDREATARRDAKEELAKKRRDTLNAEQHQVIVERNEKLRQDQEKLLTDKEHLCEVSRAVRFEDLKREVQQWHRELEDLKPTISWIEHHCKYKDTSGTLVQKEHIKEGVIVRIRTVGSENELVCDIPKPSFISPRMMERYDYVNIMLTTYRGQQFLYRGSYSQQNRNCASSDAVVGMSYFFVTHDDGAMQRSILEK